jgi:hypothetical protein
MLTEPKSSGLHSAGDRASHLLTLVRGADRQMEVTVCTAACGAKLGDNGHQRALRVSPLMPETVCPP